MKESRLPISSCTNCGKRMDAATHMGEAIPRPGDFTVCLHCSHVMAFSTDLTLRDLTGAEIVACAGRPDLLRLQAAIDFIKRQTNARSSG